MLSLFDQTNVVAPMTESEAATWKAKVGNTAGQLRVLLFEGYERQAWAALGHTSWTDCVRAIAEEYEFSERHMWRLHAANETESLLTHGSVGEIPERVLRPLTGLPPDLQPIAYQKAIDTAPNGKVTAAHVQSVVDEYDQEIENEWDAGAVSLNRDWTEEELDDYAEAVNVVVPPKPHVTHNSGNNEWNTPAIYIEAARNALGAIDLDPASNHAANETVKASTYYTVEDDGLRQDWSGRVWMNPPYADGLVAKFTDKLAQHVRAGDVPEAIVLVNNATETVWFQTLAAYANAICFPKSRIRFEGSKESGPLQGQAFIYIGRNTDNFAAEFAQFGLMLRSYDLRIRRAT